jgi:hypothetical protein
MLCARRIAVLTAMLMGMAATSVHADVITNSPNLPPVSDVNGNPIVYLTATQVHATYTGAGLTAILSQIQHGGFTNIQRVTSGANEVDTFNSTLTGLASINGSANIPVTLSGPVQVTEVGKAGMTTGTFPTIMNSMDMTGNVAGHSVEVKLDPARATTGSTTISDNVGGTFRISSFFDVFTELSIDGGTFIPQSEPGGSLVTATAVPEPSSMVLLGVMGTFGVATVFVRRRRSLA